MSEKQWKIKEFKDSLEIRYLADSLNISEVLSKILISRDIKTFAQAKYYFYPSLENLHDPFLMDGMHCATLRVIKAIANHEKILVYGDYDVDGTCSTALMYMFLQQLNANVDYFIPNRLRDGYGITTTSIDHVKSLGTTLMISVDCGITAVEETDYANTLGIDIIICDHHQPKEILPAAYAVLDPLKPGCDYPFKYLSGAGVAFKLAQGVANRIGKRLLPLQFLDLVAMAGAADIVPLADENRILVSLGLLLLNEKPRPGVRALLESAHIEVGRLTSGQIVFSLAPRINAVGRMSDASIAVDLLMTQDMNEAYELAGKLETDNFQRKKVDEGTLNSALAKIESSINLEEDLAIVLHEEDWHPGVIGIVASRLAEKYYRPTVMLTTIDGVAKGSARSIPNFNIYESLRLCEDLLVHFGGHKAAAGLSIEIANIPEFKRRFNEIVKVKLFNTDMNPAIDIDAKINFSEITHKFILKIQQFAPYGPLNPRPVLLSENIEIVGHPKVVGTNHLLFQAKQKGCEKVFDAIGFDFGGFARDLISKQKQIDLVYTIDEGTRDGKIYPQLKIKDIHLRDF